MLKYGFFCSISILGQSQSEEREKSAIMKFAVFYSDVKSYFAAHAEEYKRFRECDTVRQKLAFLVRNGMVRIVLQSSRLISVSVNLLRVSVDPNVLGNFLS